MCGICGFWGSPDIEAVDSMLNAMRHRGPDDGGSYGDEQVAIGMRRLAILDLSPAGHQPMSTPDGLIWIVFNGEIYNFQAERDVLEAKGIPFKSHSDTEVILRLYELYGDDFLTRLRGMFALAIYDKRGGAGHERLLLARDPLGIKPLLYAQRGEQVIFASEMKALLASGRVEREINPEGLRLLLTYGSVYQSESMIKGVKMLPPGNRLVFEKGCDLQPQPFWQFGTNRVAGARERAYDDLVDVVAETLQESVRLHMVSDVPVGAFLSGGVDSSLLVGLMTRLAGSRIKTFSVGFESAPGNPPDESDEAARTAAFLGADHTHVMVTAAEASQHLMCIVKGLDQPTVDGVNSYFVSMAAAQGVKVAVSGTGGDELFAGYPWFTQMQQFAQRPAGIKTWLSGLRDAVDHRPAWDILPSRIKNAIFHQQGFLGYYSSTYRVFGPSGAMQLLTPGLKREVAAVADIRDLDALSHAEAVDRVTALTMRSYLNNQLLRDIDTASMAHSLEVRVPFLDLPLLDLALSLPVSARLGNTQNIQNAYAATYRQLGSKRILIDAGLRCGVLRPDIADQPKRGFTLPFDFWLHGTLQPVLADCLSVETVTKRGLLNPAAVTKVYDNYKAGKSNWIFPWLLMILELWCREMLD